MKISILILASVFTLAASAEDTKITMFKRTGDAHNRSAEVCGKLIQPTGKPAFIKLVVDYDTKVAGNYYVWAGSDGNFCAVVATYYGRVEASLEDISK